MGDAPEFIKAGPAYGEGVAAALDITLGKVK
jgi:hypothetical protein